MMMTTAIFCSPSKEMNVPFSILSLNFWVCVCVRVGVIRLPRNLGIPLEIVLFYWGAYVCAHAHEGVRWSMVITYACTHRDWAITSQQLG